jgi:hypothetical protein
MDRRVKQGRFCTDGERGWDREAVMALTFDTDNCPDEAIAYVCDKLEAHGFAGTFFCTRRYESLRPPHEAALHPFITTHTDFQDMVAPIEELKSKIPEAVGNRCHQLAANSTIYGDLPKRGILYDSSWPMALCPGISPIMLHTGLVQLPIYWMEGLYFQHGRSPHPFDDASRPGLRVHLFHPVHLWHNTTPQSCSGLLATPYLERYRSGLRQKGPGIDDHFDALLAGMAEGGVRCRTCAEITREALDACPPKEQA